MKQVYTLHHVYTSFPYSGPLNAIPLDALDDADPESIQRYGSYKEGLEALNGFVCWLELRGTGKQRQWRGELYFLAGEDITDTGESWGINSIDFAPIKEV